MFCSFSNYLAKSGYISFFSLSFDFTLWSARTAKSIILQVSIFFLLIIIRSGRLAEIRWSVSMSKSLRSLSYFPGQILGCAYTVSCKFSHQLKLMVFRCSLSDSKSSQVSRIRLIATMQLFWWSRHVLRFPALPVPFRSLWRQFRVYRLYFGITVIFMFSNLFSSPDRSKYLPLFLFSFILTLWPVGTTKFTTR